MYVAIIFTFLVILLFIYRDKRKKSVKAFPGPKPLFLLGNILDFTSPSKIIWKFMEYMETYGNIVMIHMSFYRNILFVSDYKLTERILTSTKMLEKSFMYDPFKNWLATGLLMSTGSKWKSRRKMITPSFHFSILRGFIKTFESVGDIFIKKLNQEVGKPSVDIYPLVSLYALDVMCEASMGTSVNAQSFDQSEYVRSVKIMCKIIMERLLTPLHPIVYPLTPNYFKEKKALKVLHSYTDEVIDRRIRSRLENPEVREEGIDARRNVAFLDLLLESTIDGKPLTRADLREEVDTFMFEGHDTTASAITFIIYSLAVNPEVQKKVVDEQEAIFGRNCNATISPADIQNMKYLDMVVKESLRLYPSVPLIGRIVDEDFEWDGVVIPQGQAVGVFIFYIHRNPQYFSNPEQFIPERFENVDGKQPFCYIPFSAGPRNCIGQKFAMMEIKSTISKVIRNFELYPANPVHKLELSPEAILLSRNGVRISLKKRQW